MIRVGNRIRLTKAEFDIFKSSTGANEPPKTVEEYNLKIRNTMAFWTDVYVHENCAEAGLLAAMCEMDLIAE